MIYKLTDLKKIKNIHSRYIVTLDVDKEIWNLLKNIPINSTIESLYDDLNRKDDQYNIGIFINNNNIYYVWLNDNNELSYIICSRFGEVRTKIDSNFMSDLIKQGVSFDDVMELVIL